MQIKNVLNMQRLISNDIPPWQFKVCYYCQVNKYAIIIKFNLTVGLFFFIALELCKEVHHNVNESNFQTKQK